MKLYGDFTKSDWLNVLGTGENKVPLSVIIHGEGNHEENLNLWKDVLNEESWLPKWNTVIWKFKGKYTGFANLYGSPIAATITHQFASVGNNQFILTGYFGCLSFDVEYGNILILSEAEM